MNILISADSTCDLAKELISAYGIAITPLYVIMEQDMIRDGECSPQDIFAYTARTGKLCTTSAVGISDYEDFFTAKLKEYDSIIHFTISAEMSSCYNNACAAAMEHGERVHIIDSRSVSSGIGLQVLRAAQDRDAGLSAREILSNALNRRDKTCIFFVPETLEYLHKGGRCSTVATLGANILKLKPCIETIDGKMLVGKKYRGSMQKVVKDAIHDHFDGREDIGRQWILLPNSFGDSPFADMVKDELLTVQSFTQIVNCPLGATVCCHCGPNTMGIVFEYC